MRYKVKGRLIKSENAAKPNTQKSKFILNELANLKNVPRSLDYGCGKLRYLLELQKISDELFLLDSEIQLSRNQIIHGQKINIIQFIQNSNNINLYEKRSAFKEQKVFDRIFCFNVLSAVPIPCLRWQIILNCYRLLKSNGSLILSHQYRNSDFTRMRNMENALQYNDGFIVDSYRGSSFYSPFPRDELIKKVEEIGFNINTKKIHDGTILIIATK